MTVNVIPGNKTVDVGKAYSVDQSIKFIITAVPSPENKDSGTTYQFEYWTDATVEYTWFEKNWIKLNLVATYGLK